MLDPNPRITVVKLCDVRYKRGEWNRRSAAVLDRENGRGWRFDSGRVRAATHME